MDVILTGHAGTNADLIPSIANLYIERGATVADVTYGRGVFWKNVDTSQFDFRASDLATGVDFTALPYNEGEIDVLVLDPPYMHGGVTVKESLNVCYKNRNTSHESVIRLYARGILEASRVLRKRGRIIVKCQDEIESGKQRLSHVEIVSLLETFGFYILDIFVLVQTSVPLMREKYQKSARKNHSYAIVAEFRR